MRASSIQDSAGCAQVSPLNEERGYGRKRTSASRRKIWAILAVFAIALAWFAAGVESSGIASAECDPVSHIGAQDESVYLREAIEMSVSGHWATPTYLGRYALNKPPLLQWLTALSLKLFGISAWAGRLPSLVAAALISVAIFFLVSRSYSLAAAVCSFLLLVSSHLFYVFSRLCITDMLLTLWLVAAMFILARDARLERISSAILFGASSGAAILTKGAAGLLPLIALGMYCLLAPRDQRPRLRQLWPAAAALVAVALPWHAYQFVLHPHWFFAEYILTQHLSVGVTAPPQYSNENHLVFYARRMFLMDPVLTIASIAALPFLLRKWRSEPLTLAWLAAVLAGLFAFRYRSGYYLLPVIPVLALLSAEVFEAIPRRARVLLVVVLAVCTAGKTALASPVWGIPAGRTSWTPLAGALESYCGEHRGNDLMVVGSDDAFYASDLPLARVRYSLPGVHAQSPLRQRPLDFDWLGIAVPAPLFRDLESHRAIFRSRLASFDLPFDAGIATVIWVQSPTDVAGLVESHPDADFLVKRSLLRSLGVNSPHRILPAGPEHFFLLAPRAAPSRSGAWPCEL